MRLMFVVTHMALDINNGKFSNNCIYFYWPSFAAYSNFQFLFIVNIVTFELYIILWT